MMSNSQFATFPNSFQHDLTVVEPIKNDLLVIRDIVDQGKVQRSGFS